MLHRPSSKGRKRVPGASRPRSLCSLALGPAFDVFPSLCLSRYYFICITLAGFNVVIQSTVCSVRSNTAYVLTTTPFI